MDDRIDRKDTIVTRILEGAITIDSLKEFENLLKIFPDNPGIHRIFADFLAKEKPFAAADNYRISANLFTQAGQMLQAIISKILEWRLVKPSHQEVQEFHSDLHKGGTSEVPVQRFFAGLAFRQFVAFVNELTLHYVPAQNVVKKIGDRETHIRFVVSGVLEQTTQHPLKKDEKVPEKTENDLIENDFFGEIYPFEEEKVSQSEIRTATRVELAEIPKSMLAKICRQYPDVEPLLDCLYQTRLESDEKNSSKMVRKAVRHQLPTQVNLKVFQDQKDKARLEISGFTNDISLYGTSVILGAKYKTSYSLKLIGKNVKIQICLPIESSAINILGTVVWGKDITLDGKTTTLVGIVFKEISNSDSNRLKEYCYGSEGEQNLIWSLWSSLLGK